MIARLRGQDREGYAACCTALAAADLRGAAASIAVPTLVIAGADDPVTTVADAGWLVDTLPDAQLTVVPASHISNLEAVQPFGAALQGFLPD
jgi:3-oxoadipate enol-lactonase